MKSRNGNVLKQKGAPKGNVRKARQRQSRDVLPIKATGPVSVATDSEARNDDRRAGAIIIKATQTKAHTQRPNFRAGSSQLSLALHISFDKASLL
jgi:hypothetical protein